MSDSFGLAVKVMDSANNAPIQGATITGEVCALDASSNATECTTDGNGVAKIEGFYLTVTHPEYHAYEHQLYRRPSLAGTVPVHLQRR